MARIRTIKPDFFMSEDIGGLTVKSRLLYVALWCHADREGKMKYSPVALAAQTMPYEMADFKKCIGELIQKGHILEYEAETRKYLFIPTFLEHQRPHKTEAASKIPDFNGSLTVTPPLETGESPTGKGKGKGKEGIVCEVLAYLKKITGKNYKTTTKAHANWINARVADGHELDDFKHVIDVKSSQWLGDAKNDKFLRPETLFGNKFESYRNEKGEPYAVIKADGKDLVFETEEEYIAYKEGKDEFKA